MRYLIWSQEHQGFWKENSLGYTQNILEAGRYSEQESIDILEEANLFDMDEFRLIAPECNHKIFKNYRD
jgi:hypothetical protein